MIKRLLIIALFAASISAARHQVLAQQAPIDRDPTLHGLQQRMDALERENRRLERLIDNRSGVHRAGADDYIRDPLQDPNQPSSQQPGPVVSPPIGDEQEYAANPQVAETAAGYTGFTDWLESHYESGMVLVESSDPECTPFKLVIGNFAQVRYTNTQLDCLTFVDHLGGVRPVNPRNDITFNRDLITFTGYAFDPKMKYNIIAWASGSLASVVFAGGITYEFDKAFALNGGYNGLPGSRSLLGGFRDLAGIDRSMADSFFRPGFTQGVWASGEPLEGLYYNMMIGNSLNTLGIGAAKIDVNMAYSGSIWWEPLGNYGPVQAYNDLEHHETPVVRLGSCLTRSREDRFSDANVTNPENIQVYNSDGVLFFSTGAFAPGVTIELADYTMWAIDGGFKYNGLALNGQYFFRWLNDFKANGPLPISQTYDHGFEASIGKFLFPKLELYTRTSMVFGEFRDSSEYCVGLNWYPLANRGLRVVGEVGRIDNSPVGNIITPYQAGQSGWMSLLQAQLNF